MHRTYDLQLIDNVNVLVTHSADNLGPITKCAVTEVFFPRDVNVVTLEWYPLECLLSLYLVSWHHGSLLPNDAAEMRF